MKDERFPYEHLPEEEAERLKELARLVRGDILKMTTVAGSGHPGGSMSSTEIYLVVYSYARLDPSDPRNPDRDRIVVSHGHTSPGVYAVLGRLGFFPVEQAIAHFRQAGSVFEGHVERDVPGIEWSSGNLGQGLSAACGFAAAAKLRGKDYHVFCLMSDGEHTKGQIVESIRLARKLDLTNLTVVIDYNQIQISGDIHDVMPQNIPGMYSAHGWEVVEVDGHDVCALYEAVRKAQASPSNVCILAHTVIGKGVSFMEGKHTYHGKPLSPEDCSKALAELGLEDDLATYMRMREEAPEAPPHTGIANEPVKVETGTPRTYAPDEKTDNRSAYGKALRDVAEASSKVEKASPIAVVDCDLASSVKTDMFAEAFPERFIQVGIQEHTAATFAGAMSVCGVVTFFSDFGVFGVDETYNQHRLNDINSTWLKLVCTHNGLDVGEDGKTHQCIDYLGLLRNLYGFRVIVPADPNQTDRAIRFAAASTGNYAVLMGRSKLPVITDEEGNPFFAGNYRFEYGKMDVLREGSDCAIVTCGAMVYRALEAQRLLKEKGIEAMVVNAACPLHLDDEVMKRIVRTGVLVTYEDHHVDSGLGATVAAYLADTGTPVRFRRLGVRGYGVSGKPDELFARENLSPADLASTIEAMLG